MGIRLIVEVLDHAPAALTAQERLVLVVLAESARDDNRTSWPGEAVLSRRTGMSKRNVRRVLDRLAGRGLDVRVQLGADKRGRPIYAHRGQRASFLLPVLSPTAASAPTTEGGHLVSTFPPVDNAERRTPGVHLPAEKGGHLGQKGGHPGSERRTTDVRPPLREPSVPSDARASEEPTMTTYAAHAQKDDDDPATSVDNNLQVLMVELDRLRAEVRHTPWDPKDVDSARRQLSNRSRASVVARDVLVAMARRKRPIDNPAAYVANLADDELERLARSETQTQAAQVRKRQETSTAAEIARARRDDPDCEHGEPGGATPHPERGEPLCPLCRHQASHALSSQTA